MLGANVDQAHAQATKIVEKLAERMMLRESRPAARTLLQQEMKGLERRLLFRESDEAVQLLTQPTKATTEKELLARFSRLSGVDDRLLTEFRALTPAQKQLVVELGEGAQTLLRRYPNEGPALLQKLDVSGLAQARTYGDFVFDGAYWLQTDDVARALASTKLSAEEASTVARLLSLKQAPEVLTSEHVIPLWKSVIRKTGAGAGKFWKTYVHPHKGKWLAAGLLATYLIMPEKFHDAAGQLTEYATRKLAELGLTVAGEIGQGVVRGLADFVQSRYESNPVRTILGSVLTFLLVILAIPRVRRFFWNRLSCYNKRLSTNQLSQSTKQLSYQKPFQE
jgi:hypothetical protein